jgi:hypothetical protein
MRRAPPPVQARPANSRAGRGQNTQPAPMQVALPAQREPEGLEDPEPGPDLEHVPDLEHLVQAALAALHAPVAHLRQPERPRVRRVPHPEAVADARSSIPRPKKAR